MKLLRQQGASAKPMSMLDAGAIARLADKERERSSDKEMEKSSGGGSNRLESASTRSSSRKKKRRSVPDFEDMFDESRPGFQPATLLER